LKVFYSVPEGLFAIDGLTAMQFVFDGLNDKLMKCFRGIVGEGLKLGE
jgi:hypothetical protein